MDQGIDLHCAHTVYIYYEPFSLIYLFEMRLFHSILALVRMALWSEGPEVVEVSSCRGDFQESNRFKTFYRGANALRKSD